jgi:Spy/CpxP family protein refolding chaperone
MKPHHLLAAALLFHSTLAIAQDAPPTPPTPPTPPVAPVPPKPPVPPRPPIAGAQGGSGQLEPPQFRQALYDTIKKHLEMTDAQWDAFQPKLEKVRKAQANLRSGAGIALGRAQGGVARLQGAVDVDTPLGHAMSDLRTALEDKDVSTDELVKKMSAVREAREKAKAELKTAQDELKADLTPRQEAVLMTLGQLE